MDNRRNRTQAEKRDAERVTRAEHRIEHVIDQLVENVEGAQHSAHDSLNHEIHEHNITEWRSRLETALTVLKRSVYRMAQRRGYESLLRWAEQHAIGSTIPLDLLKAELQRRSAKLDESETEDEKRERESLDEAVRAEERRNAAVPPATRTKSSWSSMTVEGWEEHSSAH
jgi:hypothetical protein